MAAAAAARPRTKRAGTVLPPVTVARFEKVAELLEELIEQHQSVFIDAQARYRTAHHEATTRRLRPEEAAQVAAALADTLGEPDRVALAALVQQSELRAYDEPDTREVLLAAGAATAPAFLKAALRVVALIELPADVFEAAYDDDTVTEALEDPIRDLRRLDVVLARERAGRALEHFSTKAGSPEGKGWRLLVDTVWQALQTAMDKWAKEVGGAPSSLTGSLPSTTGPAATSSIGSAAESASS